jgi:hypothetical protein
MRNSKSVFLQIICGVICLSALWAQDIGSSSITGHVQLTQNTAPLIARLYSPKASIAQQSAQAESDTRRVRVAFIGTDGGFQFPGLLPGSYLLEIYIGERLLYQKVVSTQDPQPLEIAVSTVLVFKKHDWRPGDMTADPSSGVFVLDSNGGVSKLSADQQSARIDTLFQLKGAYQGYAVAASADSVYVAANSQLGCSLIKYSLSSKATTERLLGSHDQCAGIATDGTAIYVTMPQRNEIWYLDSWDAASHRNWSVSGTKSLGPMAFDNIGNRLIVADHSGNAFSVSKSDGASKLLASNLGWVNSIAASRQHILVASGTKVLSLSRADNREENPPLSLQSLTGGHIVGVAVDASDRAWFADWDKELVQGHLPLN